MYTILLTFITYNLEYLCYLRFAVLILIYLFVFLYVRIQAVEVETTAYKDAGLAGKAEKHYNREKRRRRYRESRKLNHVL